MSCCYGHETGRKDWAAKVPRDRVMTARQLYSKDGRTLVDVVGADEDGGTADATAALGSGAFGKVDSYRFHGALVAVKELKAGANEDSIGMVRCNSCVRVMVAVPLPGGPP